jgi:hypothetical protein
MNTKLILHYRECHHEVVQDLEKFLEGKPEADFLRANLPTDALGNRRKMESGVCPACQRKQPKSETAVKPEEGAKSNA